MGQTKTKTGDEKYEKNFWPVVAIYKYLHMYIYIQLCQPKDDDDDARPSVKRDLT